MTPLHLAYIATCALNGGADARPCVLHVLMDGDDAAVTFATDGGPEITLFGPLRRAGGIYVTKATTQDGPVVTAAGACDMPRDGLLECSATFGGQHFEFTAAFNPDQ